MKVSLCRKIKQKVTCTLDLYSSDFLQRNTLNCFQLGFVTYSFVSLFLETVLLLLTIYCANSETTCFLIISVFRQFLGNLVTVI